MAETTTTKTKPDKVKKPAPKSRGRYIFAVGRRKSSTVKVRFFQKGSGKFTINGRDLKEYLTTLQQQQAAMAPLLQLSLEKKVDIEVKATGGGLTGQADAIKLAVARALVKLDEDNKPTLRQSGFLTVDSRKKERKKPGLKGARRAPQWRKR